MSNPARWVHDARQVVSCEYKDAGTQKKVNATAGGVADVVVVVVWVMRIVN